MINMSGRGLSSGKRICVEGSSITANVNGALPTNGYSSFTGIYARDLRSFRHGKIIIDFSPKYHLHGYTMNIIYEL